MLSDNESQALRNIERRFRRTSPELAVAAIPVFDLILDAVTPRASATFQASARDTAVLSMKQPGTGLQIDRRTVSIGLGGAQSPSSAGRGARAELEPSW